MFALKSPKNEPNYGLTPFTFQGQSSQVTTYYFDNMGRVTNTTLPDGTSVISSYYPTGLTATNGGSRTYPVAYVYDAQGRMTNMTTWGQAGPEATTWNYDPNRGWLNSKKYPDTNGPSYTYTPATAAPAAATSPALDSDAHNRTPSAGSPWRCRPRARLCTARQKHARRIYAGY